MSDSIPLDIQFLNRFPKNLISNVIYFTLNMLIGLALVPFFLNTLGEAAYGLIPLATSVTGYVVLIISSLNTSVSRFLTIDLQRGDTKKANETFNTAVFGTLAVILLLIPVAIPAAWYAPTFFNIGNESFESVFLLFLFIFGSVLIRAWSSNFMVTLFAHNRLDLQNMINGIAVLLQTIIILLLFFMYGPSLIFVGAAYIIASVTGLLQAIYYTKKLSPYLKIQTKEFSSQKLKEIGNFSFWNLVDTFGWLLNVQIALIVVNILFGETAGAEYSLALIWTTILISISGLITSLFTPMIYAYYAKHDVKGLVAFGKTATRLVGIFAGLPIGLVCIFAPWLLTFWVGEKYAVLAPLVCLLVFPLILRFQSACINTIQKAFLKVKIQGIAVLFTGILNICLAFYLPFVWDLGVYGVAIAGIISMLIVTGIIDPLYAAYIVKEKWHVFLVPRTIGVLCLSLFVIFGWFAVSLIPITSLAILIVCAGCAAAIYFAIVMKLVVKKEELKLIKTVIPFISGSK